MKISEWLLFVSYSSGIFLQIFWPSFFGSELTAKSNEIVSSIYDSSWTEASYECRKLMNTMMEMTKKPIRITVAFVFHVDLENFIFVRMI